MDIQSLIGESLSTTQTGTGRVYIDIAKHKVSGVALKCNIAVQTVGINDAALNGMHKGVALIVRMAEDKTPNSPHFNLALRHGEQEQNLGDTLSLYRYQINGWPVCLIGPHAYVIRRWNEQCVTPLVKAYLKTLVEKAGGIITIDDGALESMLTGWMDEQPALDPDYFMQSFGTPPKTPAA